MLILLLIIIIVSKLVLKNDIVSIKTIVISILLDY